MGGSTGGWGNRGSGGRRVTKIGIKYGLDEAGITTFDRLDRLSNITEGRYAGEISCAVSGGIANSGDGA